MDQPVIAQDVPAAIRRAHHEAAAHRGPAVVVVPMDDWAAEMHEGLGLAAPTAVLRAGSDAARAADQIAGLLDAATAPVLVVGSGADDQRTWDALVALTERLGAPVWQEAFGARAGFPQDHPAFAGHLPAGRERLRAVLAPHDLALVVGTGAFRQYRYEPGPLAPDGLQVVVVSDDADDLHHSAADLAVLADPATLCEAVTARVSLREAGRGGSHTPEALEPPGEGESLRAAHVFTALAQRLPRDVVVVEETPSTRPDLHRLLPTRAPRGFVSAAMGGLGFGLPAAIGLRMGDPTRPVVALLGDGSTIYGVQGLWSAARYHVGVLFIVLANGRYAIMDRLADEQGGKAPWPAFEDVDVQALSRALGCPSRRVSTYGELIDALDEVLPTLADRREPLLLDVTVLIETEFAP